MTPEVQEHDEILLLLDEGNEDALRSFLFLLRPEGISEVLHSIPEDRWARLLEELRPDVVGEVVAGLERKDRVRFARLMPEVLHPADIADLLEGISASHWFRVLDHLGDDLAAEVIAQMEDHHQERLGGALPASELADIVEEMPSDDAADLITELPDAFAAEVVAALEPEDRHEVTALLRYEPDTAGGLMQTEFVSVLSDVTVVQAIEEVRRRYEDVEPVHLVYVVDEDGRLQGAVGLADLVVARAGTLVSEIVDKQIPSVPPYLDQEEVADRIRKYGLVSMPVTDDDGRLLGRILVDDILDVVHEEASEDILRMVGGGDEDLVYSNRVFRIAAARLPWLVTTLFGSLFVGFLMSAMAQSRGDLLLRFVPAITAMGGNVGMQSATIVIRGFSIGRVDPRKVWGTVASELTVGVIMGIVCGVVTAVVAQLWLGDARVGLTVAVALFAAIAVASIAGTLIPALLKRLGTDPAIAAGPFVTTSNDMLGVLVYFLVALVLLD